MKSKTSRVALFLAFVFCSVFSVQGFAGKVAPKSKVEEEEHTLVTIDKKTTASNFKNIKSLLKDKGITVTFSDIVRDSSGNLTALGINLEDGKGHSEESQISSNSPIAPITFGIKGGRLFISRSSFEKAMSDFFNRPSVSGSQRDWLADSYRHIDDFFGRNTSAIFSNGQRLSLDGIAEDIERLFRSSGMTAGSVASFNSSAMSKAQHHSLLKSTNKLIVVDGKVSDAKTLNGLIHDDKLKAVDVLNPSTAMSVYGKKAKYGAIIATTE